MTFGVAAVGIDVGGTKIAAGLMRPDGSLGPSAEVLTPAGPTVTDTIAELVERVSGGPSTRPVGISVAGFVRDDARTVVFTPNIPEWQPGDLAAVLEARLHCPVVVENDANCAAWGEAALGAGRGTSTMVCLTVGTGLGGGLVIDGGLMRGHSGFAAEFGHMLLVPDGLPCTCGASGCWEQYASGPALLRAYLERATGVGPAVTGTAVAEAAMRGDAAAREAFAVVGRALGMGMRTLTAALDPEVFVIGGGVAETGELLLESVREGYWASVAPQQGYRPTAQVVAAQLGSQAGVIGAADLARRHARA